MERIVVSTEKVKKISLKGKEIVVVDYSGSKAVQMIEIFNVAKRLVLADNKQVLVLSKFNKNYITPAFMKHVQSEMKELERFIDKIVIVGLSSIQKWIFLGMKLWYKRELQKFDTYEEALEYLVADDKSLNN
jgi:hypothetical protein